MAIRKVSLPIQTSVASTGVKWDPTSFLAQLQLFVWLNCSKSMLHFIPSKLDNKQLVPLVIPANDNLVFAASPTKDNTRLLDVYLNTHDFFTYYLNDDFEPIAVRVSQTEVKFFPGKSGKDLQGIKDIRSVVLTANSKQQMLLITPDSPLGANVIDSYAYHIHFTQAKQLPLISLRFLTQNNYFTWLTAQNIIMADAFLASQMPESQKSLFAVKTASSTIPLAITNINYCSIEHGELLSANSDTKIFMLDKFAIQAFQQAMQPVNHQAIVPASRATVVDDFDWQQFLDRIAELPTELQDHIFCHLTFQQLLQFGKLSKAANQLMQQYKPFLQQSKYHNFGLNIKAHSHGQLAFNFAASERQYPISYQSTQFPCIERRYKNALKSHNKQDLQTITQLMQTFYCNFVKIKKKLNQYGIDLDCYLPDTDFGKNLENHEALDFSNHQLRVLTAMFSEVKNNFIALLSNGLGLFQKLYKGYSQNLYPTWLWQFYSAENVAKLCTPAKLNMLLDLAITVLLSFLKSAFEAHRDVDLPNEHIYHSGERRNVLYTVAITLTLFLYVYRNNLAISPTYFSQLQSIPISMNIFPIDTPEQFWRSLYMRYSSFYNPGMLFLDRLYLYLVLLAF